MQFFRQDILLWKSCRATANGDSAQCRVKPSRHGAGTNIQGHTRKERFHLNHSTFHLREEESEHEHLHTSTSEADLLKLSGMPETRTRFDKRAKTCRTPSSSGPLWKTLIAQITIDDKIGHIMSLEYNKGTGMRKICTAICPLFVTCAHCFFIAHL